MWACHLHAVQVFQRCELAGVGGGLGGVLWTGIPATEVRAALAIERIPRADWSAVAEDVQFMGHAVAASRMARARQERQAAGKK